MSDKQTAAMLDKKLDEKTAHTMFICGIVMVIAVLIHDGDHIRQALNWGYQRSAVSSRLRPSWACTSSARPQVCGACGTSPTLR